MSRLHEPDVARLIKAYGITAIVETGTGPNSSALAIAESLDLEAFSCDMDPRVIAAAKAKYPHAYIRCQDSRDFLCDVLPDIVGPSFFWLDSHFPEVDGQPLQTDDESAYWPLYEEMQTVQHLARNLERCVIWCDDIRFIDDASNPEPAQPGDLPRTFNGHEWWGDRWHSWAEYLDIFRKTHKASVKDGILCLTPR